MIKIDCVQFSQADILQKLQREILPLQGYKAAAGMPVHLGCPALEHAFPNRTFPTAAIHEFICTSLETTTASTGFIAAVTSGILKTGAVVACVGVSPILFPPAFTQFDIDPSNIIFINTKNDKQVLWVMEEALKCNGLSVVIGEVGSLSFTNSRRFQLAVEKSRVTGFILHRIKKQITTNACISRWQVTSLPSQLHDGLPGVGFPRWKVELLKVRNGEPGSWTIEWKDKRLHEVRETMVDINEELRKVG